LTVEEETLAGGKGICVLTEGIEDALAVAIARPDWRVWACGSLTGIADAPWFSCISGFIVAADNDLDNAGAQRGLERSVNALKRHGVPVAVSHSFSGKDFTDALGGV